MKNYAFLILIFLITLTGCSAKPVVEQNVPEPLSVQGEMEQVEDVEIRELQMSERNPFVAGSDSGRERLTSEVDSAGRDPFVIGSDQGRDSLTSAVEPDGRNPFTEVPNVTTVPDEPVVPEVPDEVVIPEEPGDPVVHDAIQVRIVTLDRCWLDVYIDNVRILRDNVPGGRTLILEAAAEVRLEQVGREQMVSVTVNGKDLGILSVLVQRLENGSYVDREAGVRVTLERRYPGGVLVGLRFTALNGDN